MVDWSKLRPGMRGLAVEGTNDKTIVEAFLDAGERIKRWSDWRSKMMVEVAGKTDAVIRALKQENITVAIWGLIDRDWRTEQEIAQLQADYPRLLILPRVTIENYCTDPADVEMMLPPARRSVEEMEHLRQIIEAERDGWTQQGALSQALYEGGAYEFCRGPEGYPKALLDTPAMPEADVRRILDQFRAQLDPGQILSAYRTRLTEFRTNGVRVYRQCINGKMFFDQVVVSKALNVVYEQRDRGKWLSDLFANAPDCPDDLALLLSPLVS